jgi:hypothetical protein
MPRTSCLVRIDPLKWLKIGCNAPGILSLQIRIINHGSILENPRHSPTDGAFDSSNATKFHVFGKIQSSHLVNYHGPVSKNGNHHHIPTQVLSSPIALRGPMNDMYPSGRIRT